MRIFHTILCMGIVLLTACEKQGDQMPFAFVNVKFVGNDEFDLLDNVTGSWDFSSGSVKIEATGVSFSHFELNLINIRDTGIYTNPTINNLSYSDGLDFQPVRLNDGSIYINHLDSNSITGNFLVLLEDDFNGEDHKWVTGNFGIFLNKP